MIGNEKLKELIKSDANFILYLLDLFEGKIGVSEILNMDYSLLLAMKEVKETRLEEERKRNKNK